MEAFACIDNSNFLMLTTVLLCIQYLHFRQAGSALALNHPCACREMCRNCSMRVTFFRILSLRKCIYHGDIGAPASVCVHPTVGECGRRNVNVRTSRTGPFWHNKHFRLLLAGISAQEALVLVVLIVGAAHRGVVVVALQKGERREKEKRWAWKDNAAA